MSLVLNTLFGSSYIVGEFSHYLMCTGLRVTTGAFVCVPMDEYRGMPVDIPLVSASIG